ncbi:hypothetical protein DEO72_LG6g695 [Vigna unguiculata]|uniref:Uncharacterized protein n=1 Tax=Vigna unguiculata TaxID=3917 RepID=A0A4D6M7Z3_VIGUN|nr:hypothetical protein DEO72_LG6g695 [Vigna unguiculata]
MDFLLELAGILSFSIFVLQLATVVPEALVLLSCGLVSFSVQKDGEKPANLAQAGSPRLSENSRDSPLNFTSSGRLLGDWHLATVELSPRREGVV